MPPKIGTRGRLPSGLPPQAKEFFNCVVANCDESIRGDRIVKHFQDFVKLDVLDEAKKLDGPGDLTNGLRYIDVMCVDDTKQKNHTAFCLNNGYTSTKLPKLGCPEFKKKNDIPLPAAFSGFQKIPSKRKNEQDQTNPKIPRIIENQPETQQTETNEVENTAGSG